MTARVALADVDICSMALSHLSISTGIQSINPPDPGSEAAKVCAFWYPKMRDMVLQDAPWNFAYTYTTLASDASSVPTYPNYAYPGWPFAYTYPNDALQPIGVATYAGLRLGPAFWAAYWYPYPNTNLGLPKIPFRLAQSTATPGQQVVLCDLPPTSPVYLFYIQCVTDTAMYDALFCDMLSFYIAARVGGPLRANLQKVQAAAQAAAMARASALAQHLNASQQDLERASPSVQARW